jgi:phospholipid transport system substrate-binding protein
MRCPLEILTSRTTVLTSHQLTGPAAALAALLFACPTAEAGPPTETLRVVVAQAKAVLIAPVTKDRPAERLAEVQRLFNGVFEFRDAAAVALGPEWAARTSTEQDEFVRLFAEILGRSFVNAVAAVTHLDPGVTIRYRGEADDGEAATVRTAVASGVGDDVPFDYEMIKRGERWMVRDVLIEGVSLVANYRAQFHRVIRDSSYPGLVALLKAKTDEWSRPSTVGWEAAVYDTNPTRLPDGRGTDVTSLRDRGPAM